MENKTILLEPLFERAEEYGKTSYELLKLKTVDKTAGITAVFISRGIIVLVLSVFILIVSIGTALWLGDLLGKLYYGFFCVAGFYGIIGGVLYFFMYSWIKERVNNSIISHMLN